MVRLQRMLCRLAVPLAATIPACGTGDEIHLVGASASANPLYVRESALWPDPSAIPVCWENDGFDQEKRWTREAVELSWELFSNVDFVGWNRCPSASTEGIRIVWTNSGSRDQLGRTLGVGTAIEGRAGGMRLNNWSKIHCVNGTSFTREDCVRSSAVHEFGHALGFAHEQNRPDRPSGCAPDMKPILVAENPRVLASIDSMAGADIVGFGDDGVHTTSLAIRIEHPVVPKPSNMP